jgi:hypothetical protein
MWRGNVGADAIRGTEENSDDAAVEYLGCSLHLGIYPFHGDLESVWQTLNIIGSWML